MPLATGTAKPTDIIPVRCLLVAADPWVGAPLPPDRAPISRSWAHPAGTKALGIGTGGYAGSGNTRLRTVAVARSRPAARGGPDG